MSMPRVTLNKPSNNFRLAPEEDELIKVLQKLDMVKMSDPASLELMKENLRIIEALLPVTTLQELTQVVSKMVANKIFAHPLTINQIIIILGQQGYPNSAYEFYQIALGKHVHNALTHRYVLWAIAISPQPHLPHAIRVMKNIHADGVKIVAKNGLDETCEIDQFIDAFLYNFLISCVAKKEKPDIGHAVAILKLAETSEVADTITYSNTLDIIANSKKPDIQKALRFLTTAQNKKYLPEAIRNGDTIYLPNYSLGTTYFLLKQNFPNITSTDNPITFIYNENLLSQGSDSDIHAVKAGIIKFTAEITASPSLAIFSSNTSQFFKAAGTIEDKPLNPHATPFKMGGFTQ
jgi:hypothetical protein